MVKKRVLLLIGLAVLIISFIPSGVVLGDQLHNYNTTAGNGNYMYRRYELTHDHYWGQSFDVQYDYTINSVQLYLKKGSAGAEPHMMLVSIYGTNPDTGLISGASIFSEWFDADTLTASYAWTPITFASPVEVEGGLTYAVVCRMDIWGEDHGVYDYVQWSYSSFDPYSLGKGQVWSSVYSGGSATWEFSSSGTLDFAFKCYSTGVSSATVLTSAATGVSGPSATLNGSISTINNGWADVEGFVYGTSSVPDNPGDTGPDYSGYGFYDDYSGGFNNDYDGTWTPEFREEGYVEAPGPWLMTLNGFDVATVYYFRAYTHLYPSGVYVYGDERSFITGGCLEPVDLVVTSSTFDSISLSWTAGTGAEKTLVMYQTGSYPSTYLSGTQGYFGTDDNCTVSSLDHGITYYFRAWSWSSD